ncbi:MAG: hypothetical protein OHK0021_11830 [Bryobacter sp.]
MAASRSHIRPSGRGHSPLAATSASRPKLPKKKRPNAPTTAGTWSRAKMLATIQELPQIAAVKTKSK